MEAAVIPICISASQHRASLGHAHCNNYRWTTKRPPEGESDAAPLSWGLLDTGPPLTTTSPSNFAEKQEVGVFFFLWRTCPRSSGIVVMSRNIQEGVCTLLCWRYKTAARDEGRWCHCVMKMNNFFWCSVHRVRERTVYHTQTVLWTVYEVK
ncbi:hypothetical protein BJV77DRAFT_375448 [Russula vinacea]|nr:hypothetical protein BJV77DRAFT_375448 [Russula vinacea]